MSAIRMGPRERLADHGEEALSDPELVAAVLGTGSRGQPAARIAATLLDAYGGVAGLLDVSPHVLARHPGLGLAQACRLKAALALGRRAASRELRPQDSPVATSAAAYGRLRRLLHGPTERAAVLLLDARLRVRAELVVAQGTVTACPVHPRQVFAPALDRQAASVIFGHHHPSGEADPSAEDHALTTRLHRAGDALGVPLLDHLVVAGARYYSYADHGLMPPPAPR